MTDYNPADYATEADGYSIDLYCQPCRNTGNYNEQWVHYWNENETADLAAQDTAARQHHQRYHADPTCQYEWHDGDNLLRCTLPANHTRKHEHHGDPQCPST